MPRRKKPWKVFRVGGRVFEVCQEYDAQNGLWVGLFPDFREQPEYTAEGRPFASATDEDCPHCTPKKPARARQADAGGDCGGCAWFRRDETPWDIIGVCLCDALRRAPQNADERGGSAADTEEENPHAKEE